MSRGPWARWVALLSAREAPESLALLRVLLGLCMLHAIGSVAFTGTWALIWVDASDGGYREMGDLPWLVAALGGASRAVIGGLIAAGLTAAFSLTVGLFSRLSAFALLQIGMALGDTNPHTGGSYDVLISNALWLLVLADSGASASVDARIRAMWRPSPQPVTVPAWPRYLVIGQLLTMYASTGLQKVSASWVPGGDLSALYYILQQPTWQRIDMRWAAPLFPLTQLATLGTWLFEVGAPGLLLVLWMRRTRARPGRLRALSNRLRLRDLFMVTGLAMHAGIAILMEVGPFSFVSMALYAALLHPDEARPLFDRLLRPFGRAPRGKTAQTGQD